MNEVETLRASIAETNAALSQKVKILENNVKDAASSIKESVEQGAASVRHVTNAISPVHQIKEHPFLITGALLGLGVYLGTRSGQKTISQPPLSPNEGHSTTNLPFEEVEEPELMPASTVRAIIEPAVIGIFAAIAGEVVKKYFPKIEDQTAAIQSALIGEMTNRIVKTLK